MGFLCLPNSGKVNKGKAMSDACFSLACHLFSLQNLPLTVCSSHSDSAEKKKYFSIKWGFFVLGVLGHTHVHTHTHTHNISAHIQCQSSHGFSSALFVSWLRNRARPLMPIPPSNPLSFNKRPGQAGGSARSPSVFYQS